MTETILELAALVVAIACIASCVWQRRLVAAPHEQGLRAALRGRQAAYLFSLVTLVAYCLVSLVGRVVSRLALGSPAQDIPVSVTAVLQAVLLLGLALYAWHVLTCDEGRGAGVTRAEGGRAASRGRRVAVIALLLVVACGVALQAIWGIQVVAVFEAVALFGCLMLFEQDAWTDRRWDDNGFQAPRSSRQRCSRWRSCSTWTWSAGYRSSRPTRSPPRSSR